ncbi:hypothetical protein [Hoylesella enoeca]|uniref:Uncharacterized protein n=1 Tax=Hoylesella enoeca TaxID=76123 RepID=A0A0S2KMR6_9BACT|nr:hypothetical protein [Hoylesella enoeca]ALO49327.1 hypothetical protein AS203_09690 [Hoylesella enoeca]
MKRKELERRAYLAPTLSVYAMQTESQFLAGSEASGNAGTGGTGTADGDAKRGWIDDEEEEETSSIPTRQNLWD